MRLGRIGAMPALVAGCALMVAALAAGCGSSGGEPGVASAGGVAPSATASAGPADRDEQLRQFAQCMRDNGIDMQDPQPGAGPGGLGGMANGVNPNDPKAQAAFTACQSKLPNGGELPKLDPQQMEQYRIFAQCMRDNGADVPDPAPDGTLQLNRENLGAFTDPVFQKALTACRDKLTGLRANGTPQ